jgi:3-oxoadipate enol-lactonase
MPDSKPPNVDGTHQKIPLVLLHAFPVDRRIWRRQVVGLGDQFNVITPDFRGFGEAAGTEPVGPFSLTDLADDVKRLVDHNGLGPIVLGGLSMGGYVAAAFAAAYPKMLRGLILIDSKTEPDSPEARAGRGKMIRLAEEKGPSAVAGKLIPKMLAPDTSPSVSAELRTMIEACPATTMVTALAAMRDRPDRTADVTASGVPVLIVVGQHDVTIPPETARATAAKIPGAKVVEIPGAGHLSPMEQPDAVNAAIQAFASTFA